MSEGNWFDSIEDEKVLGVAQKFKTPADMAKSYRELEQWKGNAVRVPGPDATPEDRTKAIERLKQIDPRVVLMPGDGATDEDRAAFYESLGVPKDAAGYTLGDDWEGDPPEGLDTAVEMARELNLTRDQFRKMVKSMTSIVQSQGESAAANREEDRAVVKRAFGQAYDERQDVIAGLAEHFGHPDHGVPTESPGAWFDLLMDNIAKEFTGKGRQAPFLPKSKGGLSPGEAREQAAELRNRLMSDERFSKEERQRMVMKLTKLDQAASA